MPEIVKRTFVLVGPNAGKTITLKAHKMGDEYPFVNGRMPARLQDEHMVSLGTFLARNWNAHPEGSPELAAAQEAYLTALEEAANAGNEAAETQLKAMASEGDQPGTAPAPTNELSGNGAADPSPAGQPAQDGHGQGAIAEALMKLDHANDDHWTAEGKPKMSALEAIMGRADITRRMVEDVAPGFIRQVTS